MTTRATGIALKLLIVEDSEDDAILILRELQRRGYAPEAKRVETPEAFIDALGGGTWDIVIADYFLPGFGAPQALALWAERDLDIPFIVVSGKVGEEAAVQIMKAGAHDYLMKGNLTRLGAAVERELREANVRRERRQAAAKVRQQNERLRALTLQLAVAEENERHRIATGLHDGIAQGLVMAKLGLHRMKTLKLAAERERAVEALQDQLDRILEESRSLTFELASPILHSLGLGSALGDLCERVEAQHGVQADFKGRVPPPALSQAANVVVFQGVRELLINAIKHARAQRLTVTCAVRNGHFETTVTDDGIGFDPAGTVDGFSPTGGFGLFNTRQRVEQLGGRLVIETAPARGSRITLSLPMQDGREHDDEPPNA